MLRHLTSRVVQVRPGARSAIESLESRQLLAANYLVVSTADQHLAEVSINGDENIAAGRAYNVRPFREPQFGAPIDIVRVSDGRLLASFEYPDPASPAIGTLDEHGGIVSRFTGIDSGSGPLVEGDLAYKASTNEVFGVSPLVNGQLILFRISANATETGSSRIIGPVTSAEFQPGSVNGLEFIPAAAFGQSGDPILIGLGGTADQSTSLLFRINSSTGAVTDVVELSEHLGSTAGFVYDPAAGMAYVADGGAGGTNSLYRLNPVSGDLTLIGALNLPGGATGLALPTSIENDSGNVRPPLGLASVEILPKFIVASSFTGGLDTAQDDDVYPVSIAGEPFSTLDLHIEPLGSPTTGRLKVELLDTTDAVLLSATAPAAGQPADLFMPPDLAPVVKRLRISGEGVGSLPLHYQVNELFNAAREAEPAGGHANDSAASAQSIDPAVLDLDGDGKSDRLAARGELSEAATDQDWYSFTALAGQVIDVGLDEPIRSQTLGLEVYDSNLSLVATGIPGGEPKTQPFVYNNTFERIVTGLQIPSPGGVYYIRVVNHPDPAAITATRYDLIVGQNARLHPAASQIPVPFIAGVGPGPGPSARLLGSIFGGSGPKNVPNTFPLQLRAGETVRLTTTLSGPAYFMQLADPSGAQVSNDQGGFPPSDLLSPTITYVVPASGTYTVTIGGSVSADYLFTATVIGIQSGVRDRRIFYNNSTFDQNDPSANAADDAAIAPNKAVLLPNSSPTSANYSNYSKGINGVMIDLPGLSAGAQFTADDFEFRTGASGNPATWAAGPIPQSVSVRAGAGAEGSDRVTLIWPDYSPSSSQANQAVANAWLQVTVKASAKTGLSLPDVFYFGNLIGDTGDGNDTAVVAAADLVRTRNAVGVATISSRSDFNRDGATNASDLVIVRNNIGHVLPAFAAVRQMDFATTRRIRPDSPLDWLDA